MFFALISEYIETLNCLNFSKNWKNGGVLKLLTGRVSVRLEWSPQMLEHHALWDNREGADTEAEDSEEVPRAGVG